MSKGKEVSLIYEVKGVNVIPHLVDMMEKSKVKGIDSVEVADFIKQNIGKDDTKIWIGFNGNKITGFILAYIVYPFKTPEVFIGWAYTIPGEGELFEQLLQKTIEWAKSNKINKLSATVKKGLKAYQKKYGFQLDSYLISREI